MEELREEVGVKDSFTVGWTRDKNGRGRLTKRADGLRVEGRRRRGRPRLRWEEIWREWGSGDGWWRRQ